MRESEAERDEDDRLRPGVVGDGLALAEAGEHEAARERVGRLHPADIADLFELLSDEDRPLFASVLGDLLSPDVLAEMNEHVREPLIDLLAPEQDRKSVVYGKRVAIRVDLGGRRIVKKTKYKYIK